MKVYAVWASFGYIDLLEIFSSKHKAEVFKRKYIKEKWGLNEEDLEDEDNTIIIDEREVK